jgi:hypothetical protein
MKMMLKHHSSTRAEVLNNERGKHCQKIS